MKTLIMLVTFTILLTGCATTGAALKAFGKGMQEHQNRQVIEQSSSKPTNMNCTSNVANGQIYTSCY